jgi:phenylalanyl-tRNA synthetase alpha subunit
MTTELDRLAKKNTEQKIKGAYKNLDIKKHNIKAAMKAERASNPEENRPILGGLLNKRSDKIKKLAKAYRKVNKTDKWMEKQHDRLIDHGVWNKNKGSALAYREKQKLLKKGFPSKAKMDIDVHRPNFPRKKKQGGGIALRGLGRAFLKGGKV